MSAWKKPSRNTWVKKISTPSRASFGMSTPASRRRSTLADRHAVHALHHDHVAACSSPSTISGTSSSVEAVHVAAQLRRVGGLAHQVELVVQVLVELGDHLARLQPLAVGRQPLDPARQRVASARRSSSIAASMPGRSTLTATSRPSVQRRRSAPARSTRWPPASASKLAKTSSIGRPNARSTSRRACSAGNGGTRSCSLRELVGDVGRQQVAPRRQHLAELDEDRAEPLQRRGAGARRAARRSGGRS